MKVARRRAEMAEEVEKVVFVDKEHEELAKRIDEVKNEASAPAQIG